MRTNMFFFLAPFIRLLIGGETKAGLPSTLDIEIGSWTPGNFLNLINC